MKRAVFLALVVFLVLLASPRRLLADQSPPPLANHFGSTASVLPADPHGAVSESFVVIKVNNLIQIQDRSGGNASTFDDQTFWNRTGLQV